MDTLNKNIRFLRKQKGYTQQEFADILKIKRSSLGAYEEGRAKPNLDTQLSVARIFGITLDQLLTKNLSGMVSKQLFGGEDTVGGNDIEGKKLRVLSITVDSDNRENIEMVSQKAAAGYLNGYSDPEYIEDLPKFRLPFLPEGTYRAFEISGDSMLPLQPGSIVIGEYISDWTDIKDGLTYVLLSKQDGVVYKRIFNQVKKEQKLVLRSDNQSYPPIELDVNEVIEVWRAKLFITQASPNSLSMDKLMNMVMDLQQEVIKLKEAN